MGFGNMIKSDFSISNFPSLEALYIGPDSFKNLNSFTISHNPKLKIFETGNGLREKKTCKNCAFQFVRNVELFGMICFFFSNSIFLL